MLENPWDPSHPLNFSAYGDRYFSDYEDTKAQDFQKAILEGKYFQYCGGEDEDKVKRALKGQIIITIMIVI